MAAATSEPSRDEAGAWGAQAGAASYILVAEFDIDCGSTLTLRYPDMVPGHSEDDLADMMLPSGSQNHDWDCTYFILNRPRSAASSTALDTWGFDEFDDVMDPAKPSGSAPSSASEQQPASGDGASAHRPVLFGVNVVRTVKDSSVRRGAIIRSLCVLSEYPFVSSFRPWLFDALLEFFSCRSEHVIVDLHTRLNEIPLATLHTCRASPLAPFLPFLLEPVQEEFTHEDHRTPLALDMSAGDDDAGDGSVRALMLRFDTRTVVQLFEAVLLEKRILFIGHNVRTGLICEVVVATARLVTPVISNILQHRVYPYATLNDMSFVDVHGFIAGTANPFLEDKCPWDVLVNLTTNKIRLKEVVYESDRKHVKARMENLFSASKKLLTHGCVLASFARSAVLDRPPPLRRTQA